MKRKLLVAVVTGFLLVFTTGLANALVIYDESLSGDLADYDTENLSLNIGVNSVIGSTHTASSLPSDFDGFLFTLDSGMQLDSINYIISNVSLDPTIESTFINIGYSMRNDGHSGTVIQDQYDIEILGTSPVSIFSSSLPLSLANTYAMSPLYYTWNGWGGSWDYEFQFNVSAVSDIPEPATMLLLGTGLVGVAGAAGRKRKNQA